ncbi:MAG: Bax inhibitor-1/YccA family protein [Phycisphaerae bacterium]
MFSGNPVLGEKLFLDRSEARETNAMTVQGTATRALLLLILVVGSAAVSWRMASAQPELSGILVGGGLIGGLVLAMITIFKQEWARVTSPIYALLEGVALGAISMLFEKAYPGIVGSAVGLTFGVLLLMLVIYKLRIIRVTPMFARGVMAATGAVALVYMVSFVLRIFGTSVPYIHESGTLGILFSVAVVVIAALNLALDFHMIETGQEQGLPKYMEWYAAFALMVTLVWLYIEILRLLAKARGRR